MSAYEITGGAVLRGQIVISGAKNAALPILASTIVTEDRCVLRNCPNISDVSNALSLLQTLGCEVGNAQHELWVDTYRADRCQIAPQLMLTMRASVIFLGALLARFGEARISQPGGCPLGQRPIDLHLMALEHMGYRCEYCGRELHCREEKLRGCTITLPFPSVGATENILLAALRCPEEVVLCNAAKEPEIADMIVFLRSCGACISGENTSVLRICGGRRLHGASHTILPDRMEAATYLCAAAATRGDLRLKKVCPQHLRAVTSVLSAAGCDIVQLQDEIRISCRKLTAVGPIRTAPYDGFPTDAQAPMMAAMVTAQGVSVFEETIFADRYRHVPALRRMGAKIYATDRYAVVEGVPQLCGIQACATDLRGGAALVIAALCAEGRSRIEQISHIKRGYEDFVRKLSTCGARITE